MKIDIQKKIYNYFYLMRANSPIGTLLVMWPALWAIGLSSYSLFENIKYIIIFMIGSFLMRSCGCIINDIIDIKIDKNVERTKNRPLANGDVSIIEAICIIIIFLILSLFLVLKLNILCFYIALISIPLIIIYPFTKRITFFPQIFLGITFNLGALMAGAQMENNITLPHILIYVASILWTIGYDTIYAYQDIIDDKKNGIKSTAIYYGKTGKWWIGNFYKFSFTFILLAYLLKNKSLFILNMIFFLIAGIILTWQVRTLNLDDPSDARKKFMINGIYGFFIFLGLILNPWDIR